MRKSYLVIINKYLYMHSETNFRQYISEYKINIEKEKNKGRELSTDKSKLVCDEKVFNTISDEELFDIKNKSYIKEILENLKICIDPKCNNPRCKNLIYLYTNKKVGSTSLWGSINLYLSELFRTFHYHNIGDLERDKVYGISINQLFKILNMYNKNVFIIDIYRPIFDVCVSNYFNELNIHFQRDFNIYPEFEYKDTFVHRFLNLFEHYYSKYDVDYFNDVYNIGNCEFNFEKKHGYYQDENIKYIKLRLCDSLEWNKILSPYFGYNFELIKYNETESKSWGKYYKYFKDNYFITTNIYNKIKDNKQFSKYYSLQERESYLNNFSNRIKDDLSYGFQEAQLVFYYNIINKNEIPNILSNISLESNAPLCNNCICDVCKSHKKNIIKNNFLNKNHNKILIKKPQKLNKINLLL